jgi:hypothetical protein
MNLSALHAIASDWLLRDLLAIVWQYSKNADHRWSAEQQNGGEVNRADDNRTAVAKTRNIRIWMVHPIERTDRAWTIDILTDYNSNVKIGIGDPSTGRGYSIDLTNRRQKFERGLDRLWQGYGLYWPENMEPATYKFPKRSVIRFVVDVWLRRKPTGRFKHDPTAKHYGLQMYTRTPPRSAIYSMATIRIEVDGYYRGSFRYVPNVEELLPFVQLQKAKATIVDAN